MRPIILVGMLLLATGFGAAQLVGSPLPLGDLSGWTGTEARTLDDFQGRLVLLEFFSFW